MSINVNNIIINLRIISQIQLSDKITFKNDNFIIEKNDFLQGIIRWKNGDNRFLSLHHIENLLGNTFTVIEQLNDLKSDICRDLLSKYYITNNITEKLRNDLLTLLIVELKNSLLGIENLRKTYNNDNLMKSKIELFIEKINYKINNYNTNHHIS